MKTAHLMYNDRETGRSYVVNFGPLKTMRTMATAAKRVGHDAWVRPAAKPANLDGLDRRLIGDLAGINWHKEARDRQEKTMSIYKINRAEIDRLQRAEGADEGSK